MDGERSTTGPAGQDNGFVPPDMEMTQRFRAIPAGEPVAADEPVLLTMPDRPMGAPRPIGETHVVPPQPAEDAYAPQSAADDPMAATMAVGAVSSVQPGYGPLTRKPNTRRPGGPRRGDAHNKAIMGAALAALGVVVIGAGVAAAVQSGSSNPSGKAGPASATAPARTQRGGPSPGGSPAASAGLSKGRLVSYNTAQREQGYFEGVLTVTNRTKAPITAWQMTFSYPGANVKNIWGGVLVQGGAKPVIKGDPAAGPIPVGGSVQVRFGAAGTPSAPQGCTLNSQPC